MKREQQKALKDLNKRIQNELKGLCKKYNLKFAYDSLYIFEGDFVYTAYVYIAPAYCNDLTVFLSIKPWILNEDYWEVQKMNMEEMHAQPKTFHFRGVFTINNIKAEYFRVPYDVHDFGGSLESAVQKIEEHMRNHQKVLKSINVLLEDPADYNVSDLSKAIICIYNKEYRKALTYLNGNSETKKKDGCIHADINGKTAEQFALEYCLDKLGSH